MTDKQEAQGKIAEQLKIVRDAFAEAERIADEAGVSFSWDGPSYGMGGYYEGQGERKDETDEEWEDSDAGWSASSQSC